MLAVETVDLIKDYFEGFWHKRPKRALDGLNLSVEQGQIFGLLGPNGAGKTTTLKILLRLIFHSSGTARILGKDIADVSVHHRIGYLPEQPYFYDHLTAEEFLNFAGELFGLPASERRRRVASLLERVGLEESRNVPLRKFSKGMLQRVGIAQALINELQGCGELRKILALGVSSTEIILEDPRPTVLKELDRYAPSAVKTGERLRLEIPSELDVPKVLEIALRHHTKIVSVNPVKKSLEDYFMAQIGKKPATSNEQEEVRTREGRV